MSEPKPSPFWDFSLRIYREEGVPEACLRLQDRHGADVNVLLFALWLSTQGRSVQTADMRAAIQACEGWRQQVVVALRAIRTGLREPDPIFGEGAPAFDRAAVQKLRERIKSVELEAERLQQEALFALRPAHDWGSQARPALAAALNVDAYAQAIGAKFAMDAAATLVDACNRLGK